MGLLGHVWKADDQIIKQSLLAEMWDKISLELEQNEGTNNTPSWSSDRRHDDV